MGSRRSARGSGSSMVVVVVVAVAAAICSLTLTASAQQPADCTTTIAGAEEPGQCKSVRDCEHSMRIILKINVTDEERAVLRDNRCNFQNQEVQVCCPLDSSQNKRRRPGKAQALAASTHPLLPKDCGAAKWARSNDTEAKIDEYPWLALVEFIKEDNEKIHACGGVLISERYVLTGAHCAAGPSLRKWQLSAVRLGEWDTSMNPDCTVTEGRPQCAPAYQDIAVEEIIVHPLFVGNSSNQQNDIALIRLRTPAQLGDYVQPICLPNKQLRADELAGLQLEVAGWRAQSGPRLNKNEVSIASIENCQASYAGAQVQIQTSQLCGTSTANECLGNSGGPLMLYKDNGYLLGGLLSFGPVRCPSPGWPDIYTRVASYIEWIHGSLKA